MKCKNVNEVYEEYVEIAKKFNYKNKVILKTDCHNESKIYGHSLPIIPSMEDAKLIYCLELDKDVIKKATPILEKHDVRITNGSITKLDDYYVNDLFDIIFDFSTLDHVTLDEFPVVLLSYFDKLVKGGVLSLVVWTSDKYVVEANGKQMYFPAKMVDEFMNELFVIEETDDLYKTNGQKVLKYYRGVKK